jgi:predicted dienelactone hydrolase
VLSQLFPLFRLRSLFSVTIAVSSLALMVGAAKSSAAERIVFTFDPVGTLPISVTVKDLRDYAETGKANGAVLLYTKLAPKPQEQILRSVLVQPYRVTPNTIEQFTATHLGNQMLQQLSQVLRLDPKDAPQPTNSAGALKAGLVKAAKNPQGFTLLSFFEAFPAPVLRIDVKQSLAVVRELSRLFQYRDTVVASLRTQSQAATSSASNSVPASLDLKQSGPVRWQMETFTVENPDRKRSFPVDLYRPSLQDVEQLPVPLVIISHGLASNRGTFGYLAQHLATHGYAVAVVEHPGTSTGEVQRFLAGFDNESGPEDWLNRPRDITYTLDTLTKLVQTEVPGKSKINLGQVGILGQSLGGYTSLAVAGATLNLSNLRQVCPRENSPTISLNIALLFQCEAGLLKSDRYELRDPRIKAAIAVNSIGSEIFSPAGFQAISIPTLMISGADDVIAPTIAEQVTPFSWLQTPQKYLVVVEKGTHFSFLGGNKTEQVVQVPAELIGPNQALARPLLQTLSTAFFNRYLRQDRKADAYLSNAGTQRISTAPFKSYLLQQVDLPDLDAK